MLAKSFKDRADKITISADSPGLVQCKYNGGRCVEVGHGSFSRKGEKYAAIPHIEEELMEFFQENPHAFLDGELFNEDLRKQLNEIMSLIRRTVHLTQEHYDRSRDLIKLYVYDGYGFGGTTKETPYKERKDLLDKICEKYKYLEFVPTHEVHSVDDMWKVYDEFVSQGHEGAILRFPDSPYEHKRSSNLLKLKPTDDAEFLVTDVQPGSGNWAEAAKIVVCQTDDGRVFSATFKGTMENAKLFLNNKEKYVGKKYTIYFNGLTGKGDGLPNYAQFDYANSVEEKMK
jgi:ATP-dependent DNA ligase